MDNHNVFIVRTNRNRILEFIAGAEGGSSSSSLTSSSTIMATTNPVFAVIAAKRKCPSFGPGNVEAWACTEIEEETFSFLWTVKNFSSFITSTTTTSTTAPLATNVSLVNDEVKSPVFKGGPQQNSWQLKINPKKKVDNVDFLSVHLILASFGDEDNNSVGRKIKVRFQITLLTNQGKPGKQAGSQSMNVCEFKKNSTWGYDKFIIANEILCPIRRLLDDNCLSIHCRIWIEGDLKHKTGSGGLDQVSRDELKVKRLRGLSDDLGKLLYSSETADVAINTSKYTFMAHRVILAARSPVFNRMFETEMVESKNSSVDITDFDKEVVQGMLEYMYSGHTELLNEKAPELMQIAEKYDLSGLKEDCEIEMVYNLTVENAAEVLVLAHLHNAVILKPAVINFINRNKDAVKKTKTFQDVAKANSHVFVDLYLSQDY